jgi:hypothetical protein
MKKLLLAAALATAFASGPAGAADRSSASAHACAGEGRLASICKAPLFKQYTSCIDDAIPQWDPKGPVLSKMNVPPASSVLAVLVQCESIAKKFGKKYGNDLANVLQEVANKRVSEQFGTDPLVPN